MSLHLFAFLSWLASKAKEDLGQRLCSIFYLMYSRTIHITPNHLDAFSINAYRIFFSISSKSCTLVWSKIGLFTFLIGFAGRLFVFSYHSLEVAIIFSQSLSQFSSAGFFCSPCLEIFQRRVCLRLNSRQIGRFDLELAFHVISAGENADRFWLLCFFPISILVFI